MRRYALEPPEDRAKGLDLSKPQYFTAYGEWTKKAGIACINPGKPGADQLTWADATFGGLKPKNADRLVYTSSTVTEPNDYYISDLELKQTTRLTDQRPQVADYAWSEGSMLINYTRTRETDSRPRSTCRPATKREIVSTIVYIYERLSQGAHQFATPTANGFNRSVYTSNGYAVLTPDITYKINDPGMSAVWCVVPALKAAIATGIVDAKVGLQGHSWGGYQTSFLVTQTDMFAAAVAGAPLTNMVSLYSLIYKNTGGTNQAIFESSQGRFKGGYWENWDAYYRNSPVFFAKNVKTPLMILHNDRDGAVDFTQGVEYYNTLRRLQKPVIMLEYVGENHGLRKRSNQRDYTAREGVLRSLPARDSRARLDEGRRAAPEDGRAPEGAREAEDAAEEDHDDGLGPRKVSSSAAVLPFLDPDLRTSGPAAPAPSTTRGWSHVDVHEPAVDEHVAHARAVLEQIALGHDDVGDLAALERSEARVGAGDSGGVNRQSTHGGVGRQPFLDGARGVAHEVPRLAHAIRREREQHTRLLERRRCLRGLCAGAQRAQRLIGIRGQRPRPRRVVQAVDDTCAAGLQIIDDLVRFPCARDDRIEVELLRHGERASYLAREIRLERNRHAAREGWLEGFERCIVARSPATRFRPLIVLPGELLVLRVDEVLAHERDVSHQRAGIPAASGAGVHRDVQRNRRANDLQALSDVSDGAYLRIIRTGRDVDERALASHQGSRRGRKHGRHPNGRKARKLRRVGLEMIRRLDLRAEDVRALPALGILGRRELPGRRGVRFHVEPRRVSHVDEAGIHRHASAVDHDRFCRPLHVGAHCFNDAVANHDGAASDGWTRRRDQARSPDRVDMRRIRTRPDSPRSRRGDHADSETNMCPHSILQRVIEP